jgi:hypothetical protein
VFSIRLGVPEMELRWTDLCEKAATGRLGAEEKQFHKKWGKAMALLASDPRHPGLNSHEIGPLSRRYGEKVWQFYLENRNPRAARMYWVYGPGKNEITVIGLEPHPEDKKSSGYAKVRLSATGRETG